MHMQGTPRTMQQDPTYDDVVDDVKAFLAERIEAAVGAGIAEERIWVDPGIGFGKTVEHNLELLRRLGGAARARAADRGRHLAQDLHRQDHRPRGRRAHRRDDRLQRAGVARAAPRCCGSTTCARWPRLSASARRSSGGAHGLRHSDLPDRGDDPARGAGAGQEERGFGSLYVTEHTHIPATRETPYPPGGELPREYSRIYDPLVALDARRRPTASGCAWPPGSC